MSPSTPADGLVVVGYDGSAASQRALVWAAGVARALGDELRIIHAVELDLVAGRRGRALRPLNPSLEMVAETMVGGPSTWPGQPMARSRVRAVHAFGGPAGELVDASMTADLVVLGTRGRGRARSALVGSVSSAVAAHAYCPVVVLHDLAHPARGARRAVSVPGPGCEVVCAVTPAADSEHQGEHEGRVERRVAAAVRLAAGCSAPLRLVTVLPQPGATSSERPGLEAVPYDTDDLARGHPGLEVTPQTLFGDPVDALTCTSRDAGVLVIGAPHAGGVAAVLAGTPAYRVIRDASCPVMVVH